MVPLEANVEQGVKLEADGDSPYDAYSIPLEKDNIIILKILFSLADNHDREIILLCGRGCRS